MGINKDFKALLKVGLKRTIPSFDVFLEAVTYKTNNESIAKLASKSEIIEKAGQELLILPPVNKNSSNTIAHSSHASHGSHGSHASHSSHYSGR